MGERNIKQKLLEPHLHRQASALRNPNRAVGGPAQGWRLPLLPTTPSIFALFSLQRQEKCMDNKALHTDPDQPKTRSPGTESSSGPHTKPQEPCVICLEPISERAVAVPCNHCCFDFICAASWLQECSQCPLCKVEVTALQYDWRSPDDYKKFKVQTTVTSPPPASTYAHRNRYHHSRRPRRQYNIVEPGPDTALLQRRHVYRHNLYSLHVGSNRVSQFRDFTPCDFASSSVLQSRARKWIRRELRVFDFLYPSGSSASPSQSSDRRANNAEFLLEYIIAILKTVEIKGSSGKAEDMLQVFLGRGNAKLFLHELEAWLRSPYSSLEDWDRHVQYREKLPLSFNQQGPCHSFVE